MILCVCGSSYAACKAHASCLIFIFGLSSSAVCLSHYLINGTIDGKKSVKYFFYILSTAVVCNISFVVLCVYCCHLMCICCTMCVLLSPYVYLLYYVCIAVFFTLDAGLLARSQYSEGPTTGHLDTGFSSFPCVYKQMLRWFPRFQVATTCFSCSPPDLNLVVTNFVFCLHVK